ncbi:MAG TPA: hypothetical protein VHH32_05780, partial [Gemmatimonadales bacterium]|nr:hypothetical protein [Gemmatimonadales bacterium]
MTHLIHLWLWLAAIGAPPRPARLPMPPDSGEVRITLDSTLSAARAALARGRPWQATRLLTDALRDSTSRTPATIFLAAKAASEWGGWTEVLQLLSQEPWIDSLYEGRARVLLTRGALELRADSVALLHAMESLRRDPSSGERLMLLGTALARNSARDSAAAVLVRAATRLPSIAEWIRLRAAAVTADSTARANLYGSIEDPLPKSRIPWTEATAYENTGNLVEAARRYAQLGEHITSLRLRIASTSDSAPRAAVRGEVFKLLAGRLSPGAARQLIALIDSAFAPLGPAEELLAARAASSAGLASRAATGFARAGSARLGTGEDRFAYATALTRLKRNREAAVQFMKVRTPSSLAALSAYHGARALVRDGQVSRGRKALVQVTQKYSREIEPAASAYFLLADLASDDREDVEARRLYGIVAKRYPTSRFAPTARFRAAMIALLSDQPKLAAQEFDLLAERHPASDEALGAVYWAGRAWAAAGDSIAARSRW